MEVACGQVMNAVPSEFHSKLVSIHLSKWIDSMHIQSGFVFHVCSADAIKVDRMRIEYGFGVQYGQALNTICSSRHAGSPTAKITYR